VSLSARFEEALILATRLHAGQFRKGTAIPYIAHLLGVAGIVLELGASEDEAIAALLHDAAEDRGGKAVLEDIRARFGDAVAEIVAGCTDAWTEPKPEWRPRKEAYIADLPRASASVLLVSAADKLHNARSILRDYRALGEAVWERFTGGREGTLWYYRSLVEIFRATGPSALAEELERVVLEIEGLVSEQSLAHMTELAEDEPRDE
jgi:GTP pyrophosphokinase